MTLKDIDADAIEGITGDAVELTSMLAEQAEEDYAKFYKNDEAQ